MKKLVFSLIVAMLLLAACTPAAGSPAETALLVKVGDSQKSFRTEELGRLTPVESTFKDVSYKGVTVSTLLEALSVDPGTVKAIKAVASDGFAVNYDPAQVLKDNVIVAYALADGSPMSVDDGSFRMVLPDEEGKLNPRMLAELQIIQ
jgi:hypothetical protein